MPPNFNSDHSASIMTLSLFNIYYMGLADIYLIILIYIKMHIYIFIVYSSLSLLGPSGFRTEGIASSAVLSLQEYVEREDRDTTPFRICTEKQCETAFI